MILSQKIISCDVVISDDLEIIYNVILHVGTGIGNRVSIGTAAVTEGNTIIGAVWGPSDWGIDPATFSINPEKQLE